MRITSNHRSKYIFELEVSTDNVSVKDDLAIHTGDGKYAVNSVFKDDLFDLLREIANFEGVCLSGLLLENLDKDEQEDLLDELNVI